MNTFGLKLSPPVVLLRSGAVLFPSCGADPPDNQDTVRPTPEPAFEFAHTAGPQHAVFVTQHWSGGGGDPVLLGRLTRTAHIDGRPVYLTSAAQEQVRQNLGPQANSTGAVLVEARIHLDRKSVSVSTDPPSNRSVYSVVIDELLRAEWYTPQ